MEGILAVFEREDHKFGFGHMESEVSFSHPGKWRD